VTQSSDLSFSHQQGRNNPSEDTKTDEGGCKLKISLNVLFEVLFLCKWAKSLLLLLTHST